MESSRVSAKGALAIVLVSLSIACSGCGAPRETASEINGAAPPGQPEAARVEELLRVSTPQGSEMVINRTTRAAGTRAPMHVHEHGGTTCVLQGEMTLFLEGAAPRRVTAGGCYWMPAGPVMTGVNTGTTEAVLHDIFVVPPGRPVWRVVEGDRTGLQSQFPARQR